MYVGVILSTSAYSNSLICIPHVCGGDPGQLGIRFDCRKYSPCMWGWSLQGFARPLIRTVFPMYVGVILRKGHGCQPCNRIPHVCGGDPCTIITCLSRHKYSPCMWGWSPSYRSSGIGRVVFPMYVGVILRIIFIHQNIPGIPHVCGGDPTLTWQAISLSLYSPCMWGWSFRLSVTQGVGRVFPMYVGVILWCWDRQFDFRGIPHVCGGDPQHVELIGNFVKYSPCMWGWSLSE